MVNHYMVNMKMDDMTDQGDHTHLSSSAFLKEHMASYFTLLNVESCAVSFSVWSFCHMREYLGGIFVFDRC